MNLLEESFQAKKEDKTRKILGIILAFIIIIVIVIIGIVSYMGYLESNTLKLQLNGKENEKLKNLLVIEEDGTVYFPIKEVASYFGYESFNGQYNNKSEKSTKCYIQNENEIANFELNSEKIYKLDLADQDKNYEYYYAKKRVKSINGVLYMSSDGIEKAFNISFDYNQEKKRMTIWTMEKLIEYYNPKVMEYGYQELTDLKHYASFKSVLKNELIVMKGEQKSKYGVINIDGSILIEPKYDSIKYLPTTGDFLVEANKKVRYSFFQRNN